MKKWKIGEGNDKETDILYKINIKKNREGQYLTGKNERKAKNPKKQTTLLCKVKSS